VYFTVTDVANEELANLFGGIHAPIIDDAPDAACEIGTVLVNTARGNYRFIQEFETH
jgi:hypothetical protein